MLFRGAMVLEFDVALCGSGGFGVEVWVGVGESVAATEAD